MPSHPPLDEAERGRLFSGARRAWNNGNFVALEIARDANGRVTGIYPVDPDTISPSSDYRKPGFIQHLSGNAVQFFEPEELIIASVGEIR